MQEQIKDVEVDAKQFAEEFEKALSSESNKAFQEFENIGMHQLQKHNCIKQLSKKEYQVIKIRSDIAEAFSVLETYIPDVLSLNQKISKSDLRQAAAALAFQSMMAKAASTIEPEKESKIILINP